VVLLSFRSGPLRYHDWMSNDPRKVGRWFSARFRVRYAETDAAGIVHHSTYLVWFEEGRSELSRQIGMPYAELDRQGVVLVLTRAEANYRSAARYDDEIEVQTRLEEVRSRTAIFGYRVLRAADGKLLADGTTEHLAVSRASGRPVRLPEPFASAYRAAAGG